MSSPARRRDAARNDERLLTAAREVFLELGPEAPVSVIAERAGIGMGSLYRRYPAKEDLMRELLLRSIEQTAAEAEKGLANADAWTGFRTFVLDCVHAGVSGAPQVGKAFEATDEILDASRLAREAVQRLLDRAQAEGVVRPDVNAHDVVLLLTELRVHPELEAVRSPELRERMIGVVLDGLRAPNASPLPAPPVTWTHIRRLWQRGRRP